MRKKALKTVLALSVTIFVLALSMSAFAATVTTTTLYNANTNDVSVTTNVADLPAGTIVTYLVQRDPSGAIDTSNVLYLNQKTADSTSVQFDYLVDKTKLPVSDLASTIKLGSNSNVTFTPATDTLGLSAITELKDAGVASIQYYKEASCSNLITDADVITGQGETVYAQVTLNSGVTFDKVVCDEGTSDEVVYTTAATTYPVKKSIRVKTSETSNDNFITATFVKPILTYTDSDNVTHNDVQAYGWILKTNYAAASTELGIVYDNVLYPAAINVAGVQTLADSFTAGQEAAVAIIIVDNTVGSENNIRPYYTLGGVVYDAVNNAAIQ